MLKYSLIQVVFALIAASTIIAQEPVREDATSDSVLASLEGEITALTTAYEQKLAALDSAYVARVKDLRKGAADRLTEMQKAIATDDLEEAIRLRDLATDIRDKPVHPPSSNALNPEREGRESRGHELSPDERRRFLVKISELEKEVALQNELARKIVGKSYQIRFRTGGIRIWTFAPNGVILSNGMPTGTRWIAFGNDAIICAGYDNGNIDICQFANGFQDIEVIFVGDFKKSDHIHRGKLITR